MSQDPLERLRISSQQKRRRGSSVTWIVVGVLLVAGTAAYFAIPREGDNLRAPVAVEPKAVAGKPVAPGGAGSSKPQAGAGAAGTTNAPAPSTGSARVEGSVLTAT